MRNFSRLRDATGAPVIFDATHSVQQPGMGEGGIERRASASSFPPLLAAAAAAGADGFFLETHPDPARAPSDAATQWPLDRLADAAGPHARSLGPRRMEIDAAKASRVRLARRSTSTAC